MWTRFLSLSIFNLILHNLFIFGALVPTLFKVKDIHAHPLGNVVAYSPVIVQTQCKPHQVTLWLTLLLLPKHNVSLIRWRCGVLPCYFPNTMYASSCDVVAYSRFSAQTQCKPHQVTLWLLTLLLPRLNVYLTSWCRGLLSRYCPDTM